MCKYISPLYLLLLLYHHPGGIRGEDATVPGEPPPSGSEKIADDGKTNPEEHRHSKTAPNETDAMDKDSAHGNAAPGRGCPPTNAARESVGQENNESDGKVTNKEQSPSKPAAAVADGEVTNEEQPPSKSAPAVAVVPLARDSLEESVKPRPGKIKNASSRVRKYAANKTRSQSEEEVVALGTTPAPPG